MVNKLLFFGLCGVLLHATLAKAAYGDCDNTPLNTFADAGKKIDSYINLIKKIEEKQALLEDAVKRLYVEVTRLNKQITELSDQLEKSKDVVIPQKRPAERACDNIKNDLRKAGINYFTYPPYYYFRFFVSAKEISNYCVGALIDKRFILILADCWSNHYIMQIILSSSAETTRVKAIHRHGHFSKSTRSDIALIELDSDVNYSPYLYPVCLYTSQLDPANLKHTYTETQLVPNAECEEEYHTNLERFEACAKDVEYNTYTRTGEPMYVENREFPKYQLFGIILMRASDRKPYIIAKVFDHLDFIERTVWPQYKN